MALTTLSSNIFPFFACRWKTLSTYVAMVEESPPLGTAKIHVSNATKKILRTSYKFEPRYSCAVMNAALSGQPCLPKAFQIRRNRVATAITSTSARQNNCHRGISQIRIVVKQCAGTIQPSHASPFSTTMYWASRAELNIITSVTYITSTKPTKVFARYESL